jgi:hypothetical protein
MNSLIKSDPVFSYVNLNSSNAKSKQKHAPPIKKMHNQNSGDSLSSTTLYLTNENDM